MDDRTYQIHETETGTHILVFNNGMFERKVFVAVSEYRDGCVAVVLGPDFRELYKGPHKFVAEWIRENRETTMIRMVATGKDFQVLPVSEYLGLHG